MRVLTENDYRIFQKVLTNNLDRGKSKTKGITVKMLMELSDLSNTKIRDTLNVLIDYGYIERGISIGREKTYFITQDGIEELKSIAQSVIKFKKEKKENEE